MEWQRPSCQWFRHETHDDLLTMTLEEEQDEQLQTLEGAFGEETQFDAVARRTTELIDQSFDLYRIISGARGVAVTPGEQYLISYVE